MLTFKKIGSHALTLIASITWTTITMAQEIYDARTITPESITSVSMDELVAKIPKGAIVIIGEQHNFKAIQEGQLSVLNALRKSGHSINVGMEFLQYPYQKNVDDYRDGKMSEEDFKKSSWGDAKFDMYRDQILFPRKEFDETTFAINSPKTIPEAVKTKGLLGLTDDEKALLPPDFKLGGESYKERFIERMSTHVDGAVKMWRYFETQSVWDDTMAWKVCEAAETSENTLALVVGQFHVEFGDGLVARIKERCGEDHPVITIYQYLFFNDEEYDLKLAFAPDAKYGAVSDYLMIVKKD